MTTIPRVRVLAAVLFSAALAMLTQATPDARTSLPLCASECGEEATCDTACEYPVGEIWAFTTCGEYDGGFENGWCNGPDCEAICGPYASPEQFCYDENVASDCETYGDYAVCEDDICANIGGNENCSTCPQDCGGACPVIVCGDSYCQGGETFRNCPADCGDPEDSGSCGDGICSSKESLESCEEDCVSPEEFCDGWDYLCPSGYQCVGNQCVADQAVLWLATCVSDLSCNYGERCLQMYDFMTETPGQYCVPWWFEYNR